MIFDPWNSWSTDYEGKCGNCHSSLANGDQYCRHCGTRRGEGKFEPYQNLMQCIYGPMPKKRTHFCPACNASWARELMIDDEAFCPHCGGPVVIGEDSPSASTLTLFSDTGSRFFSSTRYPEVKIGRSPAADLQMLQPQVSWEHALIVFQNNKWFLRDTDSSNGTRVNGRPLTPYVNTPLFSGDVIVFAGCVTMTVQVDR